MHSEIVVFGAGGHGREVVDILRSAHRASKTGLPIGFLDEDPSKTGSIVDDIPVLGGWEWLKNSPNRKVALVVAVGQPSVAKRLVNEALRIGVKLASCISPDAYLSKGAKVGKGVCIFPGCYISTGAKLRDYSTLNTSVSVGYDSCVGRFAFLGPGSSIEGDVHLGEGVFLGAGASVCHGHTIEDWCTVGAGSSVSIDLPAHTTAIGVPARPLPK